MTAILTRAHDDDNEDDDDDDDDCDQLPHSSIMREEQLAPCWSCVLAAGYHGPFIN